jgi:hypothetical protein
VHMCNICSGQTDEHGDNILHMYVTNGAVE